MIRWLRRHNIYFWIRIYKNLLKSFAFLAGNMKKLTQTLIHIRIFDLFNIFPKKLKKLIQIFSRVRVYKMISKLWVTYHVYTNLADTLSWEYIFPCFYYIFHTPLQNLHRDIILLLISNLNCPTLVEFWKT